MAVTLNSPRKIGPRSWELSWSSDLPEPTYRVYRDGVLVATTSARSMIFTVSPSEYPVVEVIDDATARPQSAHPSRITLHWHKTAATAKYLIDQQVGGEWTRRKEVLADGREYHQWRSGGLEDDQTHQFRVTPVGTNGNPGDPLDFSVLMVRHPDPPQTTMTYDAPTRTVSVA